MEGSATHGILKFREGRRRRDKIYCRFPLGSRSISALLGVTRCVAAAHQKKISRVSDMTLSKTSLVSLTLRERFRAIESTEPTGIEAHTVAKPTLDLAKLTWRLLTEVRSPAATVTRTLK